MNKLPSPSPQGPVPDRPDDSSIATRASLLDRLKNLDDGVSWRAFFDTYWGLIYGIARKAGLTDSEAKDAVQETIITASRHLPEFRYDPKVCTFKTWLLRLACWRIIDQFRKRLPSVQVPEPVAEDDKTAVALLDRLTGGIAPDLTQLWNDEWEKLVFATALERAKQRVRPEQFQIFDLYARRGMSARKVASVLGISVARVYLAKHRVAAVIKAEAQELEKEL